MLTQAEAESRARLVDVHSYAVDLDLTGGDEVFGSATVIRFAARQPGASTFIELKPAMLGRAVLNGQDLDPAALDDGRLVLPGLRADNELRVEADMAYSRAGQGMHRFTDPADGEVYLTAQCGVDNAQRVFAAFDQPDLKAPIEVTVAAPAGWTVIGNGAGRRQSAGRWRFAATPPISSYLFTVVAGRYHSVRTEHRGIPLGLHCRSSLAPYLDQEAGEILDITRACLDRYREIFDEPYPFGGYEQAFVPELAAGAMENPGCVCRDLLHRAAAAGARGLGLAAARGLTDSSCGPGPVADLRGWLADGGLPGGLELAADLRWQMLLRLAVLGQAGQPEIDRELDRDPSTTGWQWAARCRAALPEPTAKRAAWAAMFETGAAAGPELSSYLLSATAQGFWQPEQADLLAGYVPRYFPAVIQAAARRGPAAAWALVRHGFPGYAVDEAALRAGERCLEHDAPAPGLRRLLADQLDELRRALQVRSAG